MDWLRRQPRRQTRSPDLVPGEVFVHRNVANLVRSTPTSTCCRCCNTPSDVLEVRDITVCGHYGWGVRAALEGKQIGLIETGCATFQDTARHHKIEPCRCRPTMHAARLCELSVIEQVLNVAETTVLEAAWSADSACRCTAGSTTSTTADCAFDIELHSAERPRPVDARSNSSCIHAGRWLRHRTFLQLARQRLPRHPGVLRGDGTISSAQLQYPPNVGQFRSPPAVGIGPSGRPRRTIGRKFCPAALSHAALAGPG